MKDHGGMPPAAASYVNRIKTACDAMLAIEEEIDSLERWVARRDDVAIYLGVRRITEGLLRHACKVEALTIRSDHGMTLAPMIDGLRQALGKERVSSDFWDHLNLIRTRGNANAHFQQDDVYNGARIRSHNPFDSIGQVLSSLAHVAEVFVGQWPPPPGARAEPAAEEEAPEPEPIASSLPEAGRNIEASTATPTPRVPVASTQELKRYATMTVTQAREDDHARDWLAMHSDVQQRGVTRRLNAAHGATQLRKVFPSAFEVSGTVSPDEDAADRMDYLSIARLTIKQARDLDLAEDIALLVGYSPATVKNKFRSLHGGSVVHRQFPMFDEEVVGAMTLSTALRYELASFLAVAFGDSRAAILRKLRSAPGQTKLRTIFPELAGPNP